MSRLLTIVAAMAFSATAVCASPTERANGSASGGTLPEPTDAVEAFPAESAKVAPTAQPKAPARTPATKPARVIRRVREPSPRARRIQPDAEMRPQPARLPEFLGRTRENRSQAKGAQVGEGALKPQAETDASAFAPYGRLVKCELVFTVDSLNLQSPIVALCTEDVWWNGELIVPAGTEVFGRAVPNRVLNRIGDDGRWTLVFPAQAEAENGRELFVKGMALDRDEVEVNQVGDGRSWSVTDGSAGLQGFVIDEANEERVKLLLTTALSGAVRGLGRGLQTRVSASGNAGRRGESVVPSTLRNAGLEALGGASGEALDVLAKEILAEVQRNGAYVRVPAGKTFYLFVDQTLEPTEARLRLRRATP
ncbi:TrbI/VirB10 family protein [Nibricoccus sp. IMCC34717]|uniref:TrbI/VirB10 family protein n=1 Tax=Nibricoccus sp. IMCC34717 TaxID=3034021 RepID=UPI00384D1431